MTLAYDGGGAEGGWQLEYSGSGALDRELSEDGAGHKVESSGKDRIKKGERKREPVKPETSIRQNAQTWMTVSTRGLGK